MTIPPISHFIGTGWDELMAMMVVFGSLSAAVTGVILLWLRFRLRAYFVTRPDHLLQVQDFERKHIENTKHLEVLEGELKNLATRHNLKGLEQRQDSLHAQLTRVKDELGNLRVDNAKVGERIESVQASGVRVEHMMDLVLKQMLDRDQSA